MITKINKRHLISLSFIIYHLSFSVALVSCSDSFLEEKKNYGNFDNTTVYID